MSIGEVHSPFCKAIHVWRDRLRVSTQKASPIVHVVDGDKQDVGFGFVSRDQVSNTAQTKKECETEFGNGVHGESSNVTAIDKWLADLSVPTDGWKFLG